MEGFVHRFILIGDDLRNTALYSSLSCFNKDDFFILTNIHQLKTVKGLNKKSEIYLHGAHYSWMAYLVTHGYRNINWICWGAGARTNFRNYKSILFHPFKKYIYKKFKKIAVLMPQDRIALENDYGLSDIHNVMYTSAADAYPYSEKKVLEERWNGNTIYIGNNSGCIKSYLPLAKLLSKFDDIKIVCMLNYSFKESKTSKALLSFGKNTFGNKFSFDTQLYSLDKYFDYLDRCDIYLCGKKTQTGLGAIYTSLRLGKKIYLAGQNYEWIKSLGCEIFHIDELKTVSTEDFLAPLSLDQKIKNYRIVTDIVDKEKVLRQWEVFFNDR